VKAKDVFPSIFSRHASEYKRRMEQIMSRGEAVGRMRALELAAPQPGMRVLDMACGPGNLTRILAEAVAPGGEVVGIDLAPGMIELARAAGISNARFEIMDIENLGFGDATFDVVTCGHGLQFCPDLLRALREARRVLRRGGRLAASVPVGGVSTAVTALMDDVVARRLPPRPEVVDQKTTRMTVNDPELFRQAALDAGFARAETEIVDEHIHWDSAEQLVSMLSSWWDYASRMESMSPDERQSFLDEARDTLKRIHSGAIETTARNHVLFATT
jgi:ubiquinone/menaquinone biosynthesis C-methylase UbiE